MGKPTVSTPLLQESVTVSANRSPPLTSETQLEAELHAVKPYNSTLATAICLNYIIGTGCFGLPYAFTQAGLVLTSSVLVVGGLFATLAMNYTLEFMARAEGVTSCMPGELPRHRIGYRKLDFSRIGELFQGAKGRSLIQFMITCYAIGTLWSYASVFSSSTSSLYFSYVMKEQCDVQNHPSTGCLAAYYVSMAVYATIVISLALMDVGEQAWIQTFLASYRVVAFGVMLSTLAIKLALDGGEAIQARANQIGAVDWKNFAAGFGPCLLAINCHYNMPDALQPLKDKTKARQVTFTALLLSCALYLSFGLMDALAFDKVNPLASLNWTSFTACGNGWSACPSSQAGVLAVTIQLLVLLFPVINVTSSYPLVCVTVGDNLMMLAPNSMVRRLGKPQLKTTFRLIATIPPLVLATAFKKLDTIFTIAGLFGFFLGLIIPAYLQIASIDFCTSRWGSVHAAVTPYTLKHFSGLKLAHLFFWLSIVALVVAVATLKI